MQYYLVGVQASWGPNMDFQEVTDSLYYYNLYENGTFQRIIENEIESGTFEEKENGTRIEMTLTFDDPKNLLVQSCYEEWEIFLFDGKGQMLGTWADCDGPILYFKGRPLNQVGEI
jgi:hypothetical protein